ncbi:MFS transporter [Streptomyces uncialis]|uniref:MFS transporter n=1 Tax=Streptomyces uncialis TaxID=1048205 RepID=UPI002E2EE4E7|nr:MFS transporter [Streptomyces uncialis]
MVQDPKQAGRSAGPAGSAAPTAGDRSSNGLRSPWIVLTAVALGTMMEALDGTVVAVANPVIAVDLDTDLSTLQWVTNGYMLAVACVLVTAGKLGDRYGHKKFFLIGMAAFSATSVMAGLADNIGMLIFWRVLQGISGAVLAPSGLAVLKATFPKDRLKVAIGVWSAVGALAMAAGPFIGGVMVDLLNWRWVFFVNLVVGVAAFALGAWAIPAIRPEGAGRSFDLPGVVLLTATLFALVWGIIQVPEHGWGAGRTLGSFAAALVLGTLFVLRERTTAEALLPPSLFRLRAISIGTTALLVGGFAAFGATFYLALYLQQVHGFEPMQAGLGLLPFTVLFGVGAPTGAVLNQRFGPRVPLSLGLSLIAVALLGLSWMTGDSSYHAMWPFLAPLGVGMGMVAPTAIEMIVNSAPSQLTGVASGLQQTALMLGGVLGTAALGSMISARVSTVLPQELADADVPEPLATSLEQMSKVVSQGVVPVPEGTPASVARAAADAGHAAFMEGFQLAMLGGAAFVVLGALLVLLLAPRAEIVADADADATPTSDGERDTAAGAETAS